RRRHGKRRDSRGSAPSISTGGARGGSWKALVAVVALAGSVRHTGAGKCRRLTCTGLVTHGVRGLEGVEDVAGVVGEGVGGGVEVSADVDLDLEQRLQGPDDLADAVAGLVLEVAGDR